MRKVMLGWYVGVCACVLFFTFLGRHSLHGVFYLDHIPI